MLNSLKKLNLTLPLCLVILVLSAMVIAILTSGNANAMYKVNVSDLIESVISNDTKAASEMLKKNKVDDAVADLMSQTIDMMSRGGYDITPDQAEEIEKSLQDMLVSLNDNKLIEFTTDGDLSTFSKYYIADAVSYAVTSVLGDKNVTVNESVLADNFDVSAINDDVANLKASFQDLAKRVSSTENNTISKSNIKEILEKYTIVKKENAKDTVNNDAALLEMQLQLEALETMVKTLENSKYTTIDSDVPTDTIHQLSTVTTEIERIKEIISSGNQTSSGDLYNLSDITQQLAALSEKVNGMDLSGIDSNNSAIMTEVLERQAAIASLKDKIDLLGSNDQSSDLTQSIEQLKSDLSNLQVDISKQNTSQETTREVWQKTTDEKITKIIEQINTVQTSDETVNQTLNNLKNTVSILQYTVNNPVKQDISADLEPVYASIKGVQNLIISDGNNSLETVFKNLEGDTIAAKFGTMSSAMAEKDNQLSAAQVVLDSKIVAETAERNRVNSELQNLINDKYNAMVSSYNTLQSAVNNGATAEELANARQALEQSISDLNIALSGDISSLGTSTGERIADLINNLSGLSDTVTSNKLDSDAIAGDLSNYKQELSDKFDDVESSFSDVNDSITRNIESEIAAREAAVARLQAQLNSGTTDLEAIGMNVSGNSVMAKIGSVFSNLNVFKSDTESNLNDAENARVASDAAIQTDLENRVSDVKLTMSMLSDVLTASDSAIKADLDYAKEDLANEIFNLGVTYQRDIETLKEESNANLSSLHREISGNLDNLTNMTTASMGALKDETTTSMNNLRDQTNASMDALRGDTINSMGALRDATNNSMSQLRNETTTSMGALRDALDTLSATDEWAVNITLSKDSTSGPNKFGIQPSNNADLYNGWQMWAVRGQDIGVTFRAQNGTVPESDIAIVYTGAPKRVFKYIVDDDYLYIYTPDAPTDDIVIGSMHVQNKEVTN